MSVSIIRGKCAAGFLSIILFSMCSLYAPAADRRTARQARGAFTWTGGATNRNEARKMFERWADKLREFLDSHYTVK